MDSLVRAFWWGHEHGERKLHMLKRDKIYQTRCRGGLGIKKFNIMNQAFLAKQFWRITRNPNSLLAQTCKAKFHPRCSLHECTPKPHHPWFWKGIIKQDNKKLREGKWMVGGGTNIPLNHQAWFECSPLNHNSPGRLNGTGSDLIDPCTHSWKPDLI